MYVTHFLHKTVKRNHHKISNKKKIEKRFVLNKAMVKSSVSNSKNAHLFFFVALNVLTQSEMVLTHV